MSKKIVFLIIGLIFGLILGSIGGYICGHKFSKNNFGKFNNFQITEEEKSNVSSIFESSNETEIASFCEKNRPSCIYYCSQVDKNKGICSQILNFNHSKER
jgi:hypothetical protein